MLSISFTGASRSLSNQALLTSSALLGSQAISSGIVTDSVLDLPCISSSASTSTVFSYSPAYDTYQCAGYQLTGRFANSGAISASYQLGSHSGVVLTFKLASLDQWQSNSFSVVADGATVFSQVYDHSDSGRSDLCGTDCYSDYIDSVTFGFNHTTQHLLFPSVQVLPKTSILKVGVFAIFKFNWFNTPSPALVSVLKMLYLIV